MVVGGSLRSELGGEWGQARESRSLGWGRGTAEVVLKGQHFLLRREPRVHAPAQDRKRAVWNIAQHRVVSGTGGGVCIIGGGGDVSRMVSGTEGGRDGDLVLQGLSQGTWGIRKVFEGRRHLRQKSWTQGEGITEEFGT